MPDVVKTCADMGFYGIHLIAMQGPFSEELNVAMMRSVHAKWMVTKESGKAGGFGEKVSAAKKAGVGLVVIGRPAEDGISLEDGIKYLEKNFSLAASDGHEKDDADDRPEQVGESYQTGSDLINTDHIAPEKADQEPARSCTGRLRRISGRRKHKKRKNSPGFPHRNRPGRFILAYRRGKETS